MLGRVTLPNLEYPPRVLIVDRDADTRHLYMEYLKQSACEVDEAEDGREALAKALTRHPDAVITETRLSGMSGFDLCRVLRDDALTRDICIVVVTADAFESDVRRARDAGADAVLTKPCPIDELVNEIGRLLKRSRDLHERAVGLHEHEAVQAEQAQKTMDRIQRVGVTKRVMLSRAHQRRDTTEPPLAPPALVCPTCDRPLTYLKSHIGGVSVRHQEQWDYYECGGGAARSSTVSARVSYGASCKTATNASISARSRHPFVASSSSSSIAFARDTASR